MNFDFSDDQKFLQAEVNRLLTAQCGIERVRKVLNDPAISYDQALWKTVGEQGWLGAAIPEEYGGLGLGHLELCLIAEELGRALAPIPFASTAYLFAEAVLQFGTEAQKKAWLPKVAAGELIGAFAAAERPGAVIPATVQATVSGGQLTGAKLPVTDGDIADAAIVLAKEGSRYSLYIVDLKGPGVTRKAVESVDPTRSVAQIDFKGAAVERLGAGGDGFDEMQAVLDRASILIAFEQIAGSDRCLQMATDYAKQRFVFGRQLAGYQAIKHKLADMYAKNQLARGNAYYGAWALHDGQHEIPMAAAVARVSACDAYWYASKENIQTHGGIGFTWEVDCHLFYRRAAQLGLVTGSSKQWKNRVVSLLEQQNAA